MKTVFMVTRGCYSDYGVDAIFSTEAKAQAYIDAFPASDCNGIDEVEIDSPCAGYVASGKVLWRVLMQKDGGIKSSERVGNARMWLGQKPRVGGPGVEKHLIWYGWVKDSQQAIKAANECRTRMIATGEWN